MDVELLVRGVRDALARRKPAPDSAVRKLRALEPEVRALLHSAVSQAFGIAKTRDAERAVTVVSSSEPDGVDKSVVEACACVSGQSSLDSGAFGQVAVGELGEKCEALRKAGFSPEKNKRYAVKAQVLDQPTTTGRIDGIAVTGTASSVAVRSWKRESEIAKRAGEIGVGPKVHAAFVCRRPDPQYGGRSVRVGIIVMDALSKGLFDVADRVRKKALKDVPRLLGALHAEGILHGDAHEGNVMLDDAGRVFIVDYGFSTLVSELQAHDLNDRDAASSAFDEVLTMENVVALLCSKRVIKA